MYLYANSYYNFDFNITHISQKEDIRFHYGKIPLKSPSHDCLNFDWRRQSLEFFQSLNWETASGVGVVLGYNNLRALDIDGCKNYQLIENILTILDLPKDYEWVVRSGSKNGYHIIFYANDHDLPVRKGMVRAFRPNRDFNTDFFRIELRWVGHLVLPPSLHPTLNKYKFYNNKFPLNKPKYITLSNLKKILEKMCTHHNTLELLETKASEEYIETYLDYHFYFYFYDKNKWLFNEEEYNDEEYKGKYWRVKNFKTEINEKDFPKLSECLILRMRGILFLKHEEHLKSVFSELGDGWRQAEIDDNLDQLINYGNAIMTLYNHYERFEIDDLVVDLMAFEDEVYEYETIRNLYIAVWEQYCEFRQ